MKVPYKPINLKKFTSRPRYIIIHDSNCRFYDLPNYKIDDNKSIVNKMRSDYFVLYNESDLPFHFVLDKIKDDYEILVGRPLRFYCVYEDIKTEFLYSVHVGICSDLSFQKPEQRMYECLCYKILSPIMIRMGIPFKNVYLHKDVTMNPDKINCPGSFFKKEIFLSILKRMLVIK